MENVCGGSENAGGGLKKARAGPKTGGVRLKKVRGRLETDGFESDASQFQSANVGVGLKNVGVRRENFGGRHEKVGGGLETDGFESDASRFQSANVGVGLKHFGIRRENVGGRLEKASGGLKNVGVETTDGRFQSADAKFQSTAMRFRLSNSLLLFEIPMLSTKIRGPLSTKTNTAHKSLAVLDLPKRITVLITFADGVVKAMTGNATFPSPSPALATVSAAITDLQNAETAALARTKGAAATRNAKRAVLVGLLQQLRMYVQSITDQNAENAPAIIQSAGMAVKKTATRQPRVFAALAGAVSGTVKIVAPSAGQRASYDWQYSTDGKTWIDLTSTLQAKTTLTGQTPGTVVQVRYRPVTKTGATDWSAPVSYTVR